MTSKSAAAWKRVKIVVPQTVICCAVHKAHAHAETAHVHLSPAGTRSQMYIEIDRTRHSMCLQGACGTHAHEQGVHQLHATLRLLSAL